MLRINKARDYSRFGKITIIIWKLQVFIDFSSDFLKNIWWIRGNNLHLSPKKHNSITKRINWSKNEENDNGCNQYSSGSAAKLKNLVLWIGDGELCLVACASLRLRLEDRLRLSKARKRAFALRSACTPLRLRLDELIARKSQKQAFAVLSLMRSLTYCYSLW